MRKVRAFLVAVSAGGLVGAAPFLWLTIWLTIQHPHVAEGGRGFSALAENLWFALLPLTISLGIVLAASILIGLPVNWLLERRGFNSMGLFTVSGAMAGFFIVIVALVFAGFVDGYWFALLGAVSGAATGACWSRSMQSFRVGGAMRHDVKSPLPFGERVG